MTDLFTFVQRWGFTLGFDITCVSLNTPAEVTSFFFLSQPHADHKGHSCLYHIYVYNLNLKIMDIFQFGIMQKKTKTMSAALTPSPLHLFGNVCFVQ